jgi:hypothetical protein
MNFPWDLPHPNRDFVMGIYWAFKTGIPKRDFVLRWSTTRLTMLKNTLNSTHLGGHGKSHVS